MKRPRHAPRRSSIAKQSPAIRSKTSAPVILTLGHSTRSIADFIRLLVAHSVTCVVDVRTVPRSRHNPQFNRENLPDSLGIAGISYVHFPKLGGLRRTTSASPNMGWRNLSFRGYADYMQSSEFRSAVDDLIRLAEHNRLALMCAEAVPWRCHRSLIADALLVRGINAGEISSGVRLTPHRLTRFAKVRGTKITYPADAAPLSRARGPDVKHRSP